MSLTRLACGAHAHSAHDWVTRESYKVSTICIYIRKIVLKGRTQLAIIINNECAVTRGPSRDDITVLGLLHGRDTHAVVLFKVILW